MINIWSDRYAICWFIPTLCLCSIKILYSSAQICTIMCQFKKIETVKKKERKKEQGKGT